METDHTTGKTQKKKAGKKSIFKKWWFWAIIIILVVIGMFQSGDDDEILSLTGNWEEENAGDSYHAGYITEDTIVIFWVSDGGETLALYWAGSYDAPEEATDTYSWDSVNDTSRTSSALLASGDDTKTFTYEDGVLSYSVSAMGVTTTKNLVLTTTDYSAYDTSNLSSSEEVEADNDETSVQESHIYDRAEILELWNGSGDTIVGYYSVIEAVSSEITMDVLEDWYFNYVEVNDYNYYLIVCTDRESASGIYAVSGLVEVGVTLEETQIGNLALADSSSATEYLPSDGSLVIWETS